MDVRRPGRPKKDANAIPLRQQLIDMTVKLIATEGATDVSAREVCDAVGVKFASVNYNFGSWNGLIAEAGVKVYAAYVDEVWQAVQKAEKNPEARLLAYIEAQLAWARRNGGWAAIFNYPFSSKKASAIMDAKWGQLKTSKFKLNHARLTQLTIDVRDNKVTPFDYDETNFPQEELLKDTLGVQRAMMTGWISLGMMVWASRGPTMQTQLTEVIAYEKSIIDFTMQQLVAAIKGDAK